MANSIYKRSPLGNITESVMVINLDSKSVGWLCRNNIYIKENNNMRGLVIRHLSKQIKKQRSLPSHIVKILSLIHI